MGRKGKEMVEAKRKIIIDLHDQCKSLKQISKAVRRSHSAVQIIMGRFGLPGSHQNQRRTVQ
jgi:hypothetical protein